MSVKSSFYHEYDNKNNEKHVLWAQCSFQNHHQINVRNKSDLSQSSRMDFMLRLPGLGSNTYSYLYLYSNTQIFVFVFVFEKYRIGVFVFERIWKIFFKYNSNFESISAELNNIGSVAWSMLPLTNWIMTHSYCDVKFPITALIYNTNDWDELLTMTLFKFVLPNLCLL